MPGLQSLIQWLLPKVRLVFFLLGVLCWVIGCWEGIVDEYATGAWFMLVGLGLVHASEIGRPVIINLFSEATERPEKPVKESNAGYI